MTATITVGKAGRLVIPKAVRDKLQLREGTRLKVKCDEDSFSCEPEEEPVRIERRPDGRRVVVGWEGFDAGKAVLAARKEHMDRLAGKSSR